MVPPSPLPRPAALCSHLLQTLHFGPCPLEKELKRSIPAAFNTVISENASVNAFTRAPGAGGKAAAELVFIAIFFITIAP